MAVEDDLPAEQIAILERAIARVARKRSILLAGYVISLVVLIGGMLGALYVFGRAPSGRFIGWVFFAPLAAVGVILWAFGLWAKRV